MSDRETRIDETGLRKTGGSARKPDWRDTSENRSRPFAVFWGDPIYFSDQMIRVVNAEIPEADFRRIDDLRELTDGAPPQALIVHESVASDAFEQVHRIRSEFGAKIAVAYRSAETAARLTERPRAETGAPSLGFLPMTAQLDVWLMILRLLLRGEEFLPGEILRAWEMSERPAQTYRHRAGSGAESDPGAGERPEVALTPRESQVLPLVAAGKPNKTIAKELGLSEHTVKLHMHNILTKLELPNRTSAAHWWRAQIDAAAASGNGSHANAR